MVTNTIKRGGRCDLCECDCEAGEQCSGQACPMVEKPEPCINLLAADSGFVGLPNSGAPAASLNAHAPREWWRPHVLPITYPGPDKQPSETPPDTSGPGLLRAAADDPRAQVLSDAAACVLKDRNAAYGMPEDNFANIVDLWNAYMLMLPGSGGVQLTPTDVAAMMGLMKLARLATNPGHRDSWTDLAGYAACGYRCAVVAGG